MEDSTQGKKLLRRWHVVVMIAAAWLAALSPAGFAARSPQEFVEEKIDYGLVKQEIQKLEQVVNDVIGASIRGDSFAVVQGAKGAYLDKYGISISFMINIHRAVINTPFGRVNRARSTGITPASKTRRIDEMKDKLIQALLMNWDVRQLRKDECVTIVGHFEDRAFPDEPNANKTIVLKAFKSDLDELGQKADRLKEFKQRMKIVEY